MTNEEAIRNLDIMWKMLTSAYDEVADSFVLAYSMAIDALKAQIDKDTNVPSNGDTIYRQDAIDAVEESRRLNHHQDGKDACAHEYEHRHFLKLLRDLPSAQPENPVHLCDSCRYIYPECPSEKGDVIFGNGKWNDIICACNKYEPSAQLKREIEFVRLMVRNDLNGRPFYSIIYLEFDDNGVGHDFEGYSSYSLDVISDYLKKYFMPSAQPEQNTDCAGCKLLKEMYGPDTDDDEDEQND